MYKLALDLGVDVRLGEMVKDYDEDKARVFLESGEEVMGDLVIAADGRFATLVDVLPE